jgi:hypothetical protein
MSVMFGCNHCGWTGGGYHGGGSDDGRDNKNGIVAVYDYLDENGKLLFQVYRTADKKFPQRTPDGQAGWTWTTAGVRKVLYRLPDLIEAVANEHVIVIVEGEKDVESLWNIGVAATCNPGGASGPCKKPKWQPEYAPAWKTRPKIGSPCRTGRSAIDAPAERWCYSITPGKAARSVARPAARTCSIR